MRQLTVRPLVMFAAIAVVVSCPRSGGRSAGRARICGIDDDDQRQGR